MIMMLRATAILKGVQIQTRRYNRIQAIRSIRSHLYTTNTGSGPNASMFVWKDVPYTDSTSELQTLDIYTPSTPFPNNVPIIIFVHGGAWQRGNKEVVHNLFTTLSSSSFIGISINYRLSPSVKHPTHVRDIEQALRWIHENVSKYTGGSDIGTHNKVVAIGHSAGAHLLLSAAEKADSAFSIIDTFIGVSGVYNIVRLANEALYGALLSNVSLVFGPTVEDWRKASPVFNKKLLLSLRNNKSRIVLLNAQYDFHLHSDTLELSKTLEANNIIISETSVIPNTSHWNIIRSADLELLKIIKKYIV